MAWLNRIYNWVTDRNNGVPITASRMDAEFDNIVSAINTLHTSQATGEWIPESNPVAYVSATQFKVTGVDVSTQYHVGRRVLITHNSGAGTLYGTVAAVSFSTDTTVTVATDTAASILTTVTAVSYGLESYINPSYLSPRSAVRAIAATTQAYTASSAATVVLGTEVFDARGEFTANVFTAREAGYYYVTGKVTVSSPTGGNAGALLSCSLNLSAATYMVLEAVANFQTIVVSALMSLAKGETVTLKYVSSENATIEDPDTELCVMRLA